MKTSFILESVQNCIQTY